MGSALASAAVYCYFFFRFLFFFNFNSAAQSELHSRTQRVPFQIRNIEICKCAGSVQLLVDDWLIGLWEPRPDHLLFCLLQKSTDNQLTNVFIKTRGTSKQVEPSTRDVHSPHTETVKVLTKTRHVQLFLFSASTAALAANIAVCACYKALQLRSQCTHTHRGDRGSLHAARWSPKSPRLSPLMWTDVCCFSGC